MATQPFPVPVHGHVAGPQPCARSCGRSPDTAMRRVPGHSRTAGPCPQAWPRGRSLSPCTTPWLVPVLVHSRVADSQLWPRSISLSPGRATQQVPIPRQGHVAGPCHWAQPCSMSLSPGRATWQVPIPERGHAAGPHPQARPRSRSPSGPWPSHGLVLQQTVTGKGELAASKHSQPLSTHPTSDACRGGAPRTWLCRHRTVAARQEERSEGNRRRGASRLFQSPAVSSCCPVMSWANFSSLSGASLPISHLLSG